MSWPLVEIGDFCVTGSGGTPSRKIAEYYGGNIPWVKSGDLREKEVTEATEFITEAAVKKSSAKIVSKGAILLAMYGATVGRMAMLGIDAATNQAVCNITPDPNRAFSRYVYYALLSKVPEFLQNAVGGAQPNISQGMIKITRIPLPPLAEQQRIADILDKADALRHKRQQAIDLADQFLRSVFLDMFGDPVSNPKGWPVYRMGDVIDFKGGNQPPKSSFEYEPKEGYVRLIQIRDFKTDKYSTYIPEHKAKRHFEKDDVMIARYGPPVFQILRGLEGSYNVALMKASPKLDITKDFIYRVLQVPFYHDTVVANSERSAGQTGVNLDLLNNFDLPLPPLDVQEEMGRRASRIERIVEHYKNALRESEDLFNSLSQKAFSGQL